MNKIIGLLFLSFVFISFQLLAGSELLVGSRIPVFSKASSESKIVKVMKQGDVLPLSGRKTGSWLEVYLKKKNGSFGVAFVNKRFLKKSRIRYGTKDIDLRNKSVYHQSFALGFIFGPSTTRVAKQVITDTSSSSTEIESLVAQSLVAGLMMEYPYSARTQLSFRVFSENLEYTGKGKYTLSGIETDIAISQEFINLQFVIKRYLHDEGDFWWAYGGELAVGQAARVRVDTDTEDVGSDDLPFFGALLFGTGYDYRLSRDFYMVPELQLNVIVNSDISIIQFRSLFSFTYKF
ncbi:MAG: hypothetical protein AB8E15_01700 [Bdellovibrionales bacterium]